MSYYIAIAIILQNTEMQRGKGCCSLDMTNFLSAVLSDHKLNNIAGHRFSLRFEG